MMKGPTEDSIHPSTISLNGLGGGLMLPRDLHRLELEVG